MPGPGFHHLPDFVSWHLWVCLCLLYSVSSLWPFTFSALALVTTLPPLLVSAANCLLILTSWNFPTTDPLISCFILLFPHLNSQERDSNWRSLSFYARQLLRSVHGLHPLGSTGMMDGVVSAQRRSQTGQAHLLACPAWQGHRRGLSGQRRTQSAGGFHGRLPQGGEFWRQERSRIPRGISKWDEKE